jgi:hypothetical protein
MGSLTSQNPIGIHGMLRGYFYFYYGGSVIPESLFFGRDSMLWNLVLPNFGDILISIFIAE